MRALSVREALRSNSRPEFPWSAPLPDRPYFLLGDIAANLVTGAAAATLGATLVAPAWPMLVAMPTAMALGALTAGVLSVPNLVAALRQLLRVLEPGGTLRMFEHTGSRFQPFRLMLDCMTPFTRRFGPDLNRATVRNVRAAGFAVRRVEPLYLDVAKTIFAVRPHKPASP